jgi:methionyl-tRNA formyltransferase
MQTQTHLKVIFAGTPEFALPVLEALYESPHEICAVFTQPDRPAGRGQKIHASPIKQFALENHLPVFQPNTLHDAQVQQQIADLNADVMIVVAYGLILPLAILNTPKYGCINVHASLLPRWRGAAPIQRAILAGDTETGISIMQMDEGLDTGPVYERRSCEIRAFDTASSLHDKLAQIGAESLLITLDKLHNGTARTIPQSGQFATYATKIIKNEANIQWQQSAQEIDRAIRAFNPWPVAYSTLNDQHIRIWSATPLTTATNAPPGTLIQNSKQEIIVATGKGDLRLDYLQLPGGKSLATKDLLNAHAALFEPGLHFQQSASE